MWIVFYGIHDFGVVVHQNHLDLEQSRVLEWPQWRRQRVDEETRYGRRQLEQPGRRWGFDGPLPRKQAREDNDLQSSCFWKLWNFWKTCLEGLDFLENSVLEITWNLVILWSFWNFLKFRWFPNNCLNLCHQFKIK